MADFDFEASRLRFRQIAQAVSARGNDRSRLGRPFEDDPIEVDGRKLGGGIMWALHLGGPTPDGGPLRKKGKPCRVIR